MGINFFHLRELTMNRLKKSTLSVHCINYRSALIAVYIFIFFTAVADKVSADTKEQQEILMVAGEQQMLNAENIASFSEGTRGVIEVKIPRSGKKLIITAVHPGSTSLLLIGHDGKQTTKSILVFARKPETIISEMSRLIGNTGLKYIRIGPRVFVDGIVEQEQELLRIDKIRSLYEGQVLSLVQIGNTVKPRTNIRLDLTFVEINSSLTAGGGIKWPSELGAGGVMDFSYDLMTGVPAASYQVVNQAMPSLQAAQSKGYAKIKKKAYLVTTSGNQASYSSGGEINIPIAGSQAAELRTVPYGCTIKVTPRLDAGAGMIDLQIDAEVSELVETNQDAPGRTISKVSTLVHLGLGQTIVLSGLDSFTEGKSKTGLPVLSGIPIIGMLFGVHKKHKEKTKGIIAITPVVLDNVDGESRRLLNEALKKFANFKGKM
jgi:pilus assembly protein CpaC